MLFSFTSLLSLKKCLVSLVLPSPRGCEAHVHVFDPLNFFWPAYPHPHPHLHEPYLCRSHDSYLTLIFFCHVDIPLILEYHHADLSSSVSITASIELIVADSLIDRSTFIWGHSCSGRPKNSGPSRYIFHLAV